MQEEADGFARFSPASKIITGTAGPGDALWLPPGFIYCDKSSGEVNHAVRFSGFMTDCMDYLKTMASNAALFGWKDDSFAAAVRVQHLVLVMCK